MIHEHLSERTRQAARVVAESGRLAREIQGALVEPALQKDDRSPVTVADFSVQALVASRLRSDFPREPLVAEESAAQFHTAEGRKQLDAVAAALQPHLGACRPERIAAWIDRGGARPSGRCWVLDPIDGTKGFLRGAHYAVALALLEDGVVELGVLACPQLSAEDPRAEPADGGCLVIARRGRGCWMTPLDDPGQLRPLRVSTRAEPSEARLLRSVEKAHTNLGQTGEVLAALGGSAPSVGMDSQAKYALLAAGGGEIILRLLSPAAPDYRENIWDHAAGSIVVEEAGGRVSDLAGRPLDFSAGRQLTRNRGVVVSNGHVHNAVLEALQQVGVAGSRLEREP